MISLLETVDNIASFIKYEAMFHQDKLRNLNFNFNFEIESFSFIIFRNYKYIKTMTDILSDMKSNTRQFSNGVTCSGVCYLMKILLQINNISILFSIYSTIKKESIIKSNLFSLKAFSYIILCNMKVGRVYQPLRSLVKWNLCWFLHLFYLFIWM